MEILTLGNIRKAKARYRFIALRSGSNIIGINCAFPVSFSPEQEFKISIFESLYPITFAEYIRIKVPCSYAHYFLSSDQYSACTN